MTTIPPCPDSPNCVSSVPGTDSEHFVEPLYYSGTIGEAKARLLGIIRTMPRTRILRDDSYYLRVECTSFLFRFVDDLEFWFDTEEPRIDVRSASRVGHSDFGVNRKRVEEIRIKFSQ